MRYRSLATTPEIFLKLFRRRKTGRGLMSLLKDFVRAASSLVSSRKRLNEVEALQKTTPLS